jgi:dephospho-CoA kinase
LIIGLAGKSCAGKNAVASILEEKGFRVLDMDLMVHEIQLRMAPELIARFGPTVDDGKGGIDRSALGRIVFSDPARLRQLEEMLYPRLHKELDGIVASASPGTRLVVNAAALQKGEFWKRCDRILWVHAPWPVRLYRAWKRDDRSLIQIIRRFANQRQLKSQYFFSRVDTSIIGNGLSRSDLRKKVEAWIQDLTTE